MSAEHSATGGGSVAGVKAGTIAFFAGNPVAPSLTMTVIANVGLLAGSRLARRMSGDRLESHRNRG